MTPAATVTSNSTSLAAHNQHATSDDAPGAGYLHICAAEYFPKRPMHRDNNNLTFDSVAGGATAATAVDEVPFKLLNGESVEFLCKLQGPASKSASSGSIGLVALSNYRLFVKSAATSGGVANIPVRMIDSVEFGEQKRLVVWCKQCSNIRIDFDTVEQCIEWHKRLSRLPEGPSKLEELFAFAFYAWRSEECSKFASKTNLKRENQINAESFRTLSACGYEFNLEREARRLGFRIGATWRLSYLNIRYEVSATYPNVHIVPASVDDAALKRIAQYRSGGRFPSIAWRHPQSGAILARSSQPEVGWLGWRCNEDEQLISAFCTAVQNDQIYRHATSEKDDTEADGRNRRRPSRDAYRRQINGNERFLPSNGIFHASCYNNTNGSSCYTDNKTNRRPYSCYSDTCNGFDEDDASGGRISKTNNRTPRNCSPSGSSTRKPASSINLSSQATTDYATPNRTRRTAPPPPSAVSTAVVNGVKEEKASFLSANETAACDRSDSISDADNIEHADCCNGTAVDGTTTGNSDDIDSRRSLPTILASEQTEADSNPSTTNGAVATASMPSVTASTVAPTLATTNANKALLIIDARSYSAAMANRVKGGGVEMLEYYTDCDIQFMGLGNIHVLRKSLIMLRQLIVCYPDAAWMSSLEATKWLSHVAQILKSALVVVKTLATEQRSCMVHCTDGWDRTPLIIALAMVMMDPHFRTIRGFQQLIERQWVQFGHKFADRCGHNVKTDYNEISPIFLVWLDCIWQLLNQFPCDFEFNEAYLVQLAHHAYSCWFGTFLCNSASERDRITLNDRTYSLWAYLERHADDNFSNLLFVKRNVVLWPNSNQQDLLLWAKVYYPHLNPLTASYYRQNLLRQPTNNVAAVQQRTAAPIVSNVCRKAMPSNLDKVSIPSQKSNNVMTRSGDFTASMLPKARSCEDIMCMSAIQQPTTSNSDNRVSEVVSPPLFLPSTAPQTASNLNAEISTESLSQSENKSSDTIVTAKPSNEEKLEVIKQNSAIDLSASIFAENGKNSPVLDEKLAVDSNSANLMPKIITSQIEVPSEDSATNAVEASTSAANQAGTFEDVATAAAAAAVVGEGLEKPAGTADALHAHVPNNEQQQIEAAQVMIMLQNKISSTDNVVQLCGTTSSDAVDAAATAASKMVMEGSLHASNSTEQIVVSNAAEAILANDNGESNEIFPSFDESKTLTNSTTTPIPATTSANNVMSESLLRSAIFTGSSDFDGCGESADVGAVANGHVSDSKKTESKRKRRSSDGAQNQPSESSESLPSNSSLTDEEDACGNSSSSSSSPSSTPSSFMSSETTHRNDREVVKSNAETETKVDTVLRAPTVARSATPSQLRADKTTFGDDVIDDSNRRMRPNGTTRPRSNTAGALSKSPPPPPQNEKTSSHANDVEKHIDCACGSQESIDSDMTYREQADDDEYYNGTNEDYYYGENCDEDADDLTLDTSDGQHVGGAAHAKLGEDGLIMLRCDDQRRLRGIRDYYIKKLDRYKDRLGRARNFAAAAAARQHQQRENLEQQQQQAATAATSTGQCLNSASFCSATARTSTMPTYTSQTNFSTTAAFNNNNSSNGNISSPAASSSNLQQLQQSAILPPPPTAAATLQQQVLQQRRSTPSGSSTNSASNLSNGGVNNGSPFFSSWGTPISGSHATAAPMAIGGSGSRHRRPSTTAANGNIDQHYSTSADSSYSICSWDQVVLVDNSNGNLSEQAQLAQQMFSNSNELQQQPPNTASMFAPIIGGVSGVGGFMHSSVHVGSGSNPSLLMMPSTIRQSNRNVRNVSGANSNANEITASQSNAPRNLTESTSQLNNSPQQFESNRHLHHAQRSSRAFHNHHHHHHQHHSQNNNNMPTDELDGGAGNNGQLRVWIPDHAATSCYACKVKFSWLGKRKHHCRKCGRVFCSTCSDYQCPLPEEFVYQPVRVCRSCYVAAQQKCSNNGGGGGGLTQNCEENVHSRRRSGRLAANGSNTSVTTCAQQNISENADSSAASGGYYRKAIRAGGGAVLKGLSRGFPRGILRP